MERLIFKFGVVLIPQTLIGAHHIQGMKAVPVLSRTLTPTGLSPKLQDLGPSRRKGELTFAGGIEVANQQTLR